jgi:hypothetical protein
MHLKMINEIGGREIHLQGLTVEDIDKWIKITRNKSLPCVPDLQRIRQASAGLPIILEKLIRTSNLKYDEIDGQTLCKQIIKLQTVLTINEKDKLCMLSVLLYHLKYETLKSYLEVNSLHYLFERLKENKIFIEKRMNSVIKSSIGLGTIFYKNVFMKICMMKKKKNII